MVADLYREPQIRQSRRVPALVMPGVCHDPGFVVGVPEFYAVADGVVHQVGVVGKTLHHVSISPAPVFLQSLRKIPVVQRRAGSYAAVQKTVYQTVVEIYTFLVRSALSVREYPGPAYRKAV